LFVLPLKHNTPILLITQEIILILLASHNNELLDQWKRELSDFSPARCFTELNSLRADLSKRMPPVLLLDHDLLGEESLAKVETLLKASPKTKIIVSSPGISADMEWQLFRAGVRGCCREAVGSGEIGRVVEAVLQGELWIRRKLVGLLFEELTSTTQEKKHIEHAVKNLLENLTRREYEIALLVGKGESNKRIARQLDIAERTVKAHLTEIFRKLAISDRIKLALLIKDTAATLEHSEHSHSS